MEWYALAMSAAPDGPRPVLVRADGAYDLTALAARSTAPTEVRIALASLDSAIAHWTLVGAWVDEIADIAERLASSGDLGQAAVADAQYLAPIAPYRVFGAASNYIEHAAEMETKLAAKADSTPFVFLKSQSSVIGPGEAIVLPPESTKVDWEVELGVVIGARARRVAPERALETIAGYMIVNDISARDQTRRTDFPFSHDWFRGKSFDTFTPIGPWFVPRSRVPDPHDLGLRLWVNDVQMQDGSSGDMIFNIFEQIAYLSRWLALRPGDLLATGTPAGVGMARGIFLAPGDEVRAEIDLLGTLVNPVIEEPAA